MKKYLILLLLLLPISLYAQEIKALKVKLKPATMILKDTVARDSIKLLVNQNTILRDSVRTLNTKINTIQLSIMDSIYDLRHSGSFTGIDATARQMAQAALDTFNNTFTTTGDTVAVVAGPNGPILGSLVLATSDTTNNPPTSCNTTVDYTTYDEVAVPEITTAACVNLVSGSSTTPYNKIVFFTTNGVYNSYHLTGTITISTGDSFMYYYYGTQSTPEQTFSSAGTHTVDVVIQPWVKIEWDKGNSGSGSSFNLVLTPENN